ncbi:MAG: pro-sigmaK processing inhibitor BofA family protein [Bacilli bacterium]|jgi:hypothetical protein
MFKKIVNLFKKVIIATFILYAYNVILVPLNIMIPINVYTIIIITIFGIIAVPFLTLILIFIY